MSKISRMTKGLNPVNEVVKPWGREYIWADTEKYVGKILFVQRGKRLSVQYHKKKDETMSMIFGEAILQVWDNKKRLKNFQWPTELGLLASVHGLEATGNWPDSGNSVHLTRGHSFRITPGMVHCLIAKTDCWILEASSPQTKDIVRIYDPYNR